MAELLPTTKVTVTSHGLSCLPAQSLRTTSHFFRPVQRPLPVWGLPSDQGSFQTTPSPLGHAPRPQRALGGRTGKLGKAQGPFLNMFTLSPSLAAGWATLQIQRLTTWASAVLPTQADCLGSCERPRAAKKSAPWCPCHSLATFQTAKVFNVHLPLLHPF